ncbi:aromatic ring-hydroxylating dioxygenase subunit alpha [Sphingomonas sp.]|uniref:aromatic ring-hydroxylating oxygenase subunit alpha n=1 Tax=Sphingomonas sp. TaxID=28214 RepID=UPI000DB8331F|nr:aromatic ring-hydroxylating dioxygenase subunit alpha [Sphingomonas sp.]PZU06397.1 MAG: Rieske (2Fe-2S) protein [Sphingomonas sp.]
MTEQERQRDLGALVEADRLAPALYSDPSIFEEEKQRIFRSSWVWVAHESELPGADTFKTSWVGTEPVIVTRDKGGQFHVLLNRCRHRGATVCEKKKGKAPVFVCPYHAWTYETDGQLRKVPFSDGYPEPFDKADYSLQRLRVEIHNGMIFATFKDDIEPLAEWLGPARKWLDLFLKQDAGYGIKVLGEHKFRFPANWKIQLEVTTDSYHFPIVHKTFLNALDEETENLMDVLGHGGWIEDLGHGHSVMVMIPELIDLDENLDIPIPERFAELAKELATEGHDDRSVRRIVRAVGGTGFNLNLFPNLACSLALFRVLRPVTVDETEIQHIALGMHEGPEAANRMRIRLHERFQGPMGFGTPDDAECWERVQRGVKGGADMWIMINRGTDAPADGPEPGHNAGDVSAETGMRAAYAMWKRMMTA